MRFYNIGLLFCILMLSGCVGTTVKPLNICDELTDQDEWVQPLLQARATYGTPLELSLSLLEPPLAQTDKVNVKVRTPDWDNYRLSTQNWGAKTTNVEDAVDFVGWFSRETVSTNKVSWQDYRAHYLALRLGHGAFQRFQPEYFPQLEQQAQQTALQAGRWKQELAACESRWQQKPWYSRFKIW